MPRDGDIAEKKPRNISRALEILSKQSSHQQGSYDTCLWAGLRRAGLVRWPVAGVEDHATTVEKALNISREDACNLISCISVNTKRHILERHLANEEKKRSLTDRVKGFVGLV